MPLKKPKNLLQNEILYRSGKKKEEVLISVFDRARRELSGFKEPPRGSGLINPFLFFPIKPTVEFLITKSASDKFRAHAS